MIQQQTIEDFMIKGTTDSRPTASVTKRLNKTLNSKTELFKKHFK